MRRASRPYVDAFGHPPRRRVLHRYCAIIALALSGALVSSVVPITGGSLAGATSISTLKAHAEAIASEIANDNARLNSLGSTYITEHGAYVSAGLRAAETKQRIQHVEGLITRDRLRVQRAVVAAYVSGNDSASSLVSWSSNPNTEIATKTYLGVATGQLTMAVAQFQGDEHTLGDSLVAEQQALSQAATALTSTTSARGSVLLTVQTEHQLYNSANSQLNALVAAAAARALAAQERAQAAAAAASAAAAAAAGPPSPGALATASTAPTQPLNPTQPSSLAAAFGAIRNCESSNDYSLNSGNGYYGAYQFALATWQNLGQSGLPSNAPAATQDAAALLLYQRAGNSFSPWPTCAAIAGLG